MSQSSLINHQFKILLAENSRTGRAVLMQQLQNHGYTVEVVSTGMEAFNAILHSDYNLVIMDVFMPQLNGYEAAAQIRALKGEKATIPLIALTSSTNERDKKICMDAGMDEFILKTSDNEELLGVLEKYRSIRLSLGGSD